MIKFKKQNKNQEGQALLFVVVALSVALAVGVSTSLRTLSSISRVSTTDTSARVLAAAEGGLEHYLAHSTSELAADVSTCTSLDSSTSSCVVNFNTDSEGNLLNPDDPIQSRAVVKVEEFYGDPDEDYLFRTPVEATKPMSINLGDYNGGSLAFCWDAETPLFYVLYNCDDSCACTFDKGLICPTSGSCTGTVDGVTLSSSDTPLNAAAGFAACDAWGYDRGLSMTMPANPMQSVAGLVLIPVEETINFGLLPAGNQPFDSMLGYTIISKGELLQQSAVTATTVLTAQRGYPHLTPPFLFSIFGLQGFSSD